MRERRMVVDPQVALQPDHKHAAGFAEAVGADARGVTFRTVSRRPRGACAA
jgi:hypothetical protein